MERLPFVLPDFTRIMWVSDRAREILGAENPADYPSVARDRVARCCRRRQGVRHHERRRGRSRRRRRALGSITGSPRCRSRCRGPARTYASTPVPVAPGRPFAFRTVVGRLDDLQAFRSAWKATDENALGRLLGYPSCCTAFFRRVWVEDAMVDTTWPMALASAGESNGTRAVTVSGLPEANILWRWMGVRAVPHLPCRFDCQATVRPGSPIPGRRTRSRIPRGDGLARGDSWLACRVVGSSRHRRDTHTHPEGVYPDRCNPD